jgi:hypothetical protein
MDLDDSLSAVILGFARQCVDGRLTVGFCAWTAGCAPWPRCPNSPDRNRTPAVIEGGRKTNSHQISVHMLKRRLHTALGLSDSLTSHYGGKLAIFVAWNP